MTVFTPCFAATDYNVLTLPAVPSERATQSLIYTVNQFNQRFFATGVRGHILYSDDAGDSWLQAQVPVRSSILDIHFASPDKGWAVGHEGVILHSADGGKSWVKQYDGIQYGIQGLDYYQQLQQSDPDNEVFQFLIEEMQFAIEQGADKPVFRVFFHDDMHGYALGAYGMLLETKDGGKNWRHILHEFDNPGFNHLFDFTAIGDGRFFISGEIGVMLMGDINQKAGPALPTPWEGSFFTCVMAKDGSILVGGLRGNVFRSTDHGQNWNKVDKPASSAIVDSRTMSDGRVLLAAQGGSLLISDDNGQSFSRLDIKDLKRINSVVEVDASTLLVAGPQGIKKVSLVK